jgi:hypothetical protein
VHLGFTELLPPHVIVSAGAIKISPIQSEKLTPENKNADKNT